MEEVQNVEVGPIWNQRHAEEKAAEYIRNHPGYQWTGHWNTTRPGVMSTIQIRRRNTQHPVVRTLENVEVGPIWNQQHAKQKAAEYIRNFPEFQWTGQWKTTRPGRMSVIQVQRRAPPLPVPQTNIQQSPSDLSASVSHDVEVGPITGQRHAEEIAARYVANHPGTEWTGHWKTTIPGTMSVIGIRRSRRTEPDIEVQDFVWIQQPSSERALRNIQWISAAECNAQSEEAIHRERGSPSRNQQNVHVEQPSAPCTEKPKTPEEHKSSRPQPQAESYIPTCPICWEAMTPPKRIFQCTNGHLVCEVCRSQPEVQGCPTCRQPIMGRATAMEQLLTNLQRGI